MKRLFSALFILLPLVLLSAASAKSQGGASVSRIIGRVVDASSGRPLMSVQVYVNDGVGGGTLSDLDGRYLLSGVPIGTVSVTATLIGYGSKTVTDVVVVEDRATALDLTLHPRALEVQGITVSVERERGSQAFLLDERRTSGSLVEAVGAVEIGRRPDSDAAEIAKRLTGVAVLEGKYPFIRGLGGRYSQTSLNGSSLPSPEPEREVVPLDLFPAGFLQSLQTQKSYTPDLPADFSGGSVKIETRDFPNERVIRIGMGTSFNSNSQFADGYLSYGGGGLDWAGFDDGSRGQPATLTEIVGEVQSGRRLPADAGQLIAIATALRESGATFQPATGTTPLNRDFNGSLGGRADLFDDGELGYFLAGTYGDSYSIRADEVERKWRVSAFNPEVPEHLRVPNVDYVFNRGIRNVNWGGIANLTVKLNPRQKISLRTTANLSADDEARRYIGDNREDIGGTVRSDRLRFVSRLMLWSQVSGEHTVPGGSRLEWRATMARAERDEPLLRESVYLEDDGQFFLHPIGESGRYFWSDMTDQDMSLAADWSLPVPLMGGDTFVKVGGEVRSRERDFAARRLNWDFIGGTIEDLDAALSDATIVTNARRRDEFAIEDVVEPGDLYDAGDRRSAGYFLFDTPVTEWIQLIFGARVETYDLDLNSRGDVLQEIDRLDVAPSLNLIVTPREDLKVRAAGSRTVDRPEFREMAPFQFTEATSLRQLYGNPDLVPASITSGDLRVDWFPAPGEMLSAGGFYKSMTDPIEQVFIAAASTAYSFQNAREASVFGLEVEARVGMERLHRALRPFSLQTNYAYIDSNVEVMGGEGGFNPTNAMRPLEGQAAYVFNIGLDYADEYGIEAGAFLNRFGDRLTAAGGSGIPDLYEKARNQLDAVLGVPLPRGAKAKLKAINLLDADYRFEQEANGITQVQRLYTTGRTFSVGVSWEFR